MTIFWAGDEESFQLVLKAEEKLEALQASPNGMKAGYIDDMVAKLPPIWRHEGTTAVVEIDGPVVQGSAGWLRLFGVIGYDDIAKATLEAAMDPDTAAMIYHINSPGGDVAGVIDMSSLLSQVSAMKPSAVHTTDLMASAGYWLAAAIKGAHITAGPTAVVGSIGVLAVHRENSKMMEGIGVKVTVMRSGKYKAEVNSVEPLSDEARGRAESQLADVHALFRAHVGRGRPNLSAQELAEVTEGQTFLGKRAQSAGLVDQVGSFSLALKLLDKRKQSRDTSSNSKGKTMKLTPEQLKAIAAGAPMASFSLKDDGTDMSAEEIAAYEAKVREEAAAKLAEETKTPAVKVEKTDDGAGGQGAPPEGVVALLEKQLSAAQAEITTLKIAAAGFTKMAETHDGLLAIARGACANMLIPLGGTSAAVDGMDSAAVVAEHARVKPLFLEKFKVGQVSDPGAQGKTKAKIDPEFLRRTANAQAK